MIMGSFKLALLLSLGVTANYLPTSRASEVAAGDDTAHVRLVRPATTARSRFDGGGYASGGALLEVDPRGIALLRSPALANRAIKTISVVGQARTGKSFFLNALAERPPGYGFEVNATTEGLTKGLWLHHWQALDHGPDVMVDTIIGQQRNNSSSSSRTLPFECTHNGGGGSEQCAATPAVATLLLDSEGLGAPGGDLRGYDSKLVALAAMLSSAVLYNSMRFVNQFDVKFLSEAALFDRLFKNLTGLPLLDAEVVWVVQSFAGGGGGGSTGIVNRDLLDDDIAGVAGMTAEERDEELASLAACQAYPSAFLRPTGDDNHDRVVQFLNERGIEANEGDEIEQEQGHKRSPQKSPSIFCLPPPKLAVAERNLPNLPMNSLDSGYRRQVKRVRRFLQYYVPPKASLEGGSSSTGGTGKRMNSRAGGSRSNGQNSRSRSGSSGGSNPSGKNDNRGRTSEASNDSIDDHHDHGWMTGSELANLVERLVPRLNDVSGAAREVLSLHAEGARKRATARAEQQWQVRESRARRCLPLDHHPGEESLSSDEDTTSNERGSNGNRSGIIGGSTSRSGGNFKSAKDDEESLMLEALNAFDESALGDPQLAEVSRERERLRADLIRAFEAHNLRMAAAHRHCRPDTFLLCFRDYYLLKYLLPIDAFYDLYATPWLLYAANTAVANAAALNPIHQVHHHHFDGRNVFSSSASGTTVFSAGRGVLSIILGNIATVLAAVPSLWRWSTASLREAAIGLGLLKVVPLDSLCSAFADTLSGAVFTGNLAGNDARTSSSSSSSINSKASAAFFENLTAGTTAVSSLSRDGLHEHCLEVTGATKASLVWALESWADVVSPVVSTTCKRLVSWVMQGGSRSSSNSSGSSSQSSGSGSSSSSSSSSSSDGRFSKDSNLRRAPLVMLRGCALLLALVLVRALAVTAPLPAVATAAAAAAAAVGGSLPTTSPAPTMNQKPAIAHPSLGSEGGKQEPKKDQRQHLNRWRRMLFVLLHLDLLLLAILAVTPDSGLVLLSALVGGAYVLGSAVGSIFVQLGSVSWWRAELPWDVIWSFVVVGSLLLVPLLLVIAVGRCLVRWCSTRKEEEEAYKLPAKNDPLVDTINAKFVETVKVVEPRQSAELNSSSTTAKSSGSSSDGNSSSNSSRYCSASPVPASESACSKHLGELPTPSSASSNFIGNSNDADRHDGVSGNVMTIDGSSSSSSSNNNNNSNSSSSVKDGCIEFKRDITTSASDTIVPHNALPQSAQDGLLSLQRPLAVSLRSLPAASLPLPPPEKAPDEGSEGLPLSSSDSDTASNISRHGSDNGGSTSSETGNGSNSSNNTNSSSAELQKSYSSVEADVWLDAPLSPKVAGRSKNREELLRLRVGGGGDENANSNAGE